MRENFERLRQLEHHIDNSLRLYENREADDYPAHWHHAIEMIMPVENTYTVVIGDQSFVLQPEEILIVPSGVVHEILAPNDGERYLFLLDTDIFFAVRGITRYQNLFYPCVYLRGDRDGDILEIARNCFYHAIREYKSGAAMSDAAASQWLSLLFIQVIRYKMEGQEEEVNPGTSKHIRTAAVMMDVCSYITEHCKEKLTLEDIAKYSGYSKYHFSRVFRSYTGKSFYDFFLTQRIALCRKLLANPDLTITDVAMSSGFGSLATFNRVFKQYEGVSPSRYRQIQQFVGGKEHQEK